MKLPHALQHVRPLAAHALVWARRLFLPLALGFIAYSAYRASGSLRPLLANVSPTALLLAGLCWMTAQWVGPMSTTALAHAFGIPLGYRELSRIAILRIPAKYLPGGIWQSVARFSEYRAQAITGADSFAILLIEHVLALGASVLLGSALLLATQGAALGRGTASGLIIAGLILLALPVLWMIHARPSQRATASMMLLTIAATMLFWCAAGTAFLLYWTALFGISLPDIAAILAGYLLSWAAGFAAVFAPQGVGVFEWTATQLLPTALPASLIITAMAGFRIVTICGDLLAWALGLAIGRNPPRSD